MITTLKQAAREGKRLFRSCFVYGRLDQERARHVVQDILQSRRRGYLKLLKHFQRLVRIDDVRRTAMIQSAVPLPPDLRETIRTKLEHAYGPGINILFTQSPALIGGVRVIVGDDVYDGSVRAALAALERSFA